MSASSGSSRSSWRKTYSPCSRRYSEILSNAASADSGVNSWEPSHSEYSKFGIEQFSSRLANSAKANDGNVVVRLAVDRVLLDGAHQSIDHRLGAHGAAAD